MLNKLYQNRNITNKINEEFRKKGILKLESFFSPAFYEGLKAETEYLQFRRRNSKEGTFFEAKETGKIKTILLVEELSSFLKEMSVGEFLTMRVRIFSHLDYFAFGDDESNEERVSVLFFLCEKWLPDLGGNFVFKKLSGKNFYITPMENACVLLDRRKFRECFLQYVNYLSVQRKIHVVEMILSKVNNLN